MVKRAAARSRLIRALVLLVGFPGAARAADPVGVLANAPPPGPAPALAARTGELRAALAARAPGVLAPEALRERMPRADQPGALAELDRAYAGAVAAHLAGEYDAANRTLRSTADALERLADAPEVFAAWSRTLLRLARSEQELGRAASAQSLVERVLRAAPDTRADPRQYPPSFEALVENARARLRSLGSRRLTVEARPGGRVFVDGREVGPAPVTVDVAPGRHRISARSDRARSPTVNVDLSGDRTVELDLAAAEVMRRDAGPGLALPDADRQPQRLAAAGAQLGLDRLVVVSTQVDRAWEQEERWLVAALVDVPRAAVVREARVRLDGEDRARPGAVEALGAFLAGGAASSPVEVLRQETLAVTPAAAERILGAAPSPASAPRPARVAGWAALGLGVAALAAGTVAVVQTRAAQSSYDGADAMRGGSGLVAAPHTVPEYNALIDRGDRQRRVALGTGVAAGACAITSAVLSWWSWRAAGEATAPPGAR